MQTKTTLILLAIVVAVASWIIFYEKHQPNTEEAKRLAGSVVNLDRDTLEGILIHNGDDKIELRRTDDRWRVEAPIQDQADRAVIENLLSDLDTWKKEETIGAKEIEAGKAQLEEFDLVRPKLRLTLLGKDQPPEILFGRDAAFEGRMYVRFADSKETFIARNSVRDAIAKKPEEFRDRRLTEISTMQVTRMALRTPAGEMELQKEGEQWEIVKPLRARADTQKVNDLLSQVTTAQIEQFVADDRGDLQPYGLAQPRGSITLFTGDEKEGQILQIGGTPEKEKEQVYARFSARNFVYTLPQKIEKILNTTPADVRDRNLVRVNTDLLDRLTIEAGERGTVVLARKENDWTIANRNNQPANSAEVTRLLETLRNEQVTRFVEDVASDLPKFGLDQPQLQVTFSSFASENTAETPAGERPFASVAFGRVEGEEVFARVGEEPFVVAVKRSLLDQIFVDPVQWQSLSIFRFKPEEVHRLTVRTDTETTLARGENNEWKRAEGEEPIDEVNLKSLLNTLTGLRAVRWVGGPMPPQAFDQTQITVTFTTSPDDKAVHTLVVGGPAGGGMWYARVEGRDGIFVLNNPDFNALRLPLRPEAAPAAPAESPADPAAETEPPAAEPQPQATP
ncbi:MAG: DUF4340 domain-containing protein [Chthoniobacterales bacterium]|nr:DUF4340 domain-containing protein [Chthoniobacterales bacterium]